MQARDRLMPVLTALLVVVLLVGAIGVWKAADANDRRACVEAAVARYPAVSVSNVALPPRGGTGPLKLSFVKERQRAVAACE